MADGRVFLPGILSDSYDLDDYWRGRHEASRVRGPDLLVDRDTVGYSTGKGEGSVRWRVALGDDPFLTQTLQVHFNELAPLGSNVGHGHQNEAAFYVLKGRGHEIHDGRRYDWDEGDLIVVHADSVHRHFNDSDEPALLMVIKAKALWMYLGLIQQGLRAEWEDRPDFGPRQDWTRLWTPGVEGRSKIVRYEDTVWTDTRDGSVRVIASKRSRRSASVLRRSLRAKDRAGGRVGQTLAYARRARPRARGFRAQPALGSAGRDRRSLLREDRKGPERPRGRGWERSLHSAQHRPSALRRGRRPVANPLRPQPDLLGPWL